MCSQCILSYTGQDRRCGIERAISLTAEILGGRRYPIGYPVGELAELAEALWQCDSSAIAEESQDAAYACQMYVWQRLGVNAPVVCSGFAIRKFRKRNAVWKALFAEKEIEFHLDYLSGGSNFAKPAKIVAAFAAAGVAVELEEATQLSEKAQKGGM